MVLRRRYSIVSLLCLVLLHASTTNWFVAIVVVVALPFGARNKQLKIEEEIEDTNVVDEVDEEDEATVTAMVRGAAKKVSITPNANNNGDGSGNAAAATVDDVQLLLSSTVASFFQQQQVETQDDNNLSETLKLVIEATATSQEMKEFYQTTRRSLHRHPELMYELPQTSQTIAHILEELDITYTTGWAKNTHLDQYEGSPGGYGIVAQIGTGHREEPCIILRADMDALPILEATQDIDSFKSTSRGKMHACGHDGHVTMLLGAAAVLKKVEHNLIGTVRLVFQPAEEGGAGMKRMVEEGIVELEPKATFGFGMHVWPTLPTGTIASRPGALMAAAELFTIVLHGKGGHAAMPHLTIDPIVAASTLVVTLQSIVSRTLSPLESGVISVTQLSAGNAFNVIPASATICGTIRALSTDMLMRLREQVATMVDATVALHGLTNRTIDWAPDYYPPTMNDPDLFVWSQEVVTVVSPEGRLRDIEPTMGGEDFSFLAETIPSMFFLLGQGTGGDDTTPGHHLPRTDYGLHHPSFALDEHVLPLGVQLHANLAVRSLQKLWQEQGAVSTDTTSEL
mmetsp:Transcript_20074/g.23159  ORF Transcript_20074/g.23159 Transcript_20074/m.23159 type:complete len:569 (+) Transcript_20074:90-1796(+)